MLRPSLPALRVQIELQRNLERDIALLTWETM